MHSNQPLRKHVGNKRKLGTKRTSVKASKSVIPRYLSENRRTLLQNIDGTKCESGRSAGMILDEINVNRTCSEIITPLNNFLRILNTSNSKQSQSMRPSYSTTMNTTEVPTKNLMKVQCDSIVQSNSNIAVGLSTESQTRTTDLGTQSNNTKTGRTHCIPTSSSPAMKGLSKLVAVYKYFLT